MNRTLAFLSMSAVAAALTGLAVRDAESSSAQGTVLVRLQASTPGMSQVGHLNVSGTAKAGAFAGNGSLLTSLPLDQLTQNGATTGQVVKWNGSIWAPGSDATGLSAVVHDATLTGSGTTALPLGVAIPLILTGNVAASGAIIEGRNTGTGMGLRGLHTGSGNEGFVGGLSYGVYGLHSASGNVGQLGLATAGVYGLNGARSGQLATATEGAIGVFGANASQGRLGTVLSGVEGTISGTAGWGVSGIQGALPVPLASQAGVRGMSSAYCGVYGVSDQQDGVFGTMEKTGTFASGSFRGGVHGKGAAAVTPDNIGVIGEGGGYGSGVFGIGYGKGHGVIGVSGNDEPDTAAGVLGITRENLSTGGNEWPPMYGLNLSTIKGRVGILGQSKNRVAIWGESIARIGVIGTLGETLSATQLPAENAGVIGRSNLASTSGVLGLGVGDALAGVIGKMGPFVGSLGTGDAGVIGTLGGNIGKLGTGQAGVEGFGQGMGGHFVTNFGTEAFVATTGAAFSGYGPGLASHAEIASGGYGGEFSVGAGLTALRAYNTSTGTDVYIGGTGGPALIVQSAGDGAAIGGDTSVSGIFTASIKNFRIDHPLDPANKYFSHACVESDEMLNVYKGRAVLNDKGEAWVDLPNWFEVINKDFEYHLTPIGGSSPDLYIGEEVKGNRFQIAGGKPGVKVSWQVFGTRKDPYAEAHPLKVEAEKPERYKGTYQNPELYGQPKELQSIRRDMPSAPQKGKSVRARH